MRVCASAFLFFLFLPISALSPASADVACSSPGGKTTIRFRLDPRGAPQWRVLRRGDALLAWSPLGLTFRGEGALTSRFAMLDSEIGEHDETYDLAVGKTRNARDHFRELRVKLQESVAPHRRLELAFRAYDDGAAFRYILPAREPNATFEIVRENTQFHFPADLKAWAFQDQHIPLVVRGRIPADPARRDSR